MATPFTISHPLGRVPTFTEIRTLAQEFEIQISGNDQAGAVSHPKANGTYTFENKGGLRGDFTAVVLGKITGVFVLMTGKAEITITDKPYLLPVALLKSKLLQGLEAFCTRFPPAA
ncbi:MAG TPA: hypothetical protein VG347_13350 [Verrucomicrobiae bacterium]|nr:hypothetical protein [Verrucomicrobiae bacterium]